jgi:cathepsin L
MTNLKNVQPKTFIEETYGPVPNGVDWRTQGVVSPVKNQGNCGSCWSFSTTGLLESTYKLKKGIIPNFSEQQLVDCCGKKGFLCEGCNGAWPEWALNYVNSSGIVSGSAYPYKGVEGACQTTSGEKILNPSQPWTMVTAGNTNGLKTAVGAAPVSICVDASNWSTYKSGVFSNCGATNLNHAVLLVGYDDAGNWFVKNSWGTTWGASGFITLKSGNTCGLANHALVANF